MALIGVHGLQSHILPVLDHLAGYLHRQALKGLLPLGAITFSVHVDTDPLRLTMIDGVVCQLLNSVQRFSPAADDSPKILPLETHLIVALLGDKNFRSGLHIQVLHQTGEECGNLLGLLIVLRYGDRGRFCPQGFVLPAADKHLISLLELARRGTALTLIPAVPAGLLALPARFSGQNSLLFHRGGGLFLFLLLDRSGRQHTLLPGLRLFLHLSGLLLADRNLLQQVLHHRLGRAILHLIAHTDLGGVAAKTQKSGFCPLNHFNRHIVPVQAQLEQGGGDGILLRASGGLNPLDHSQIPSFFSSSSGTSTSISSTSTSIS